MEARLDREKGKLQQEIALARPLSSVVVTLKGFQQLHVLTDGCRGPRVSQVSIPSVPLALPAYCVIACAEAASNLARYAHDYTSTALHTQWHLPPSPASHTHPLKS